MKLIVEEMLPNHNFFCFKLPKGKEQREYERAKLNKMLEKVRNYPNFTFSKDELVMPVFTKDENAKMISSGMFQQLDELEQKTKEFKLKAESERNVLTKLKMIKEYFQ